jgi:hypothetical protein
MFEVFTQKPYIFIHFNGEHYTHFFTASISTVVKMTSEEYVNYMRSNFKCYFTGSEPLFYNEQEAQRAVDSLNVLYKLLNAK